MAWTNSQPRLHRHRLVRGSWILLTISLLVVTAKSDVCPETISAGCTNCQGDVCTDCLDGYYLNDQGNCARCQSDCSVCDESSCFACNEYFTLVDLECVSCQDKHCMFCNPDPSVCSSCETDYELGSDSTCRYKYTLYFVILIAIAVCLLFICILTINSWLSAKIKRKRLKQGYGLILDRDSMMKPTHSIVVTHVQDIGKTSDLNDISTVGLRNNPQGSGSEPKQFRSEELLADVAPPKSQSFLDPNGGAEDREIVEAISQAGSVIDQSKAKHFQDNWQ